MAAYYAHDAGYNGRRTVVFFGIVAAHILLIYAFASGLARRAIEMVAPPIDTTIIEEEKPNEEAPPPPPPEMERPPVQIVAPEINIPVFADAPPPPITNVTTQPVVRPPPPPPPPGTKLTPTYAPAPADYYPSLSRNAGEEGRPTIQVCVGANGKLETAEVAESSGFPRLDEAGVRYAKAMRFKPATESGQPIRQCAKLPVKFELKAAK